MPKNINVCADNNDVGPNDDDVGPDNSISRRKTGPSGLTARFAGLKQGYLPWGKHGVRVGDALAKIGKLFEGAP